MSIKLTFLRYKMRWYSTKQKMKIIDTVNELISNNEFKHRRHPGIIKLKRVEQPSWLIKTIKNILHDVTISSKMINESSKKLATHLNNRHPPPEKEDINLKLQEVQSRIYPHIHEAQNLNKNDILNNSKALKLFKSLIYNWSPISYNKYISLAYLISRSVPEYSVLYKIFNEIVNSDKNFIPKTLFDYGSGTGTVIWAASQFWYKSIKEYYCVDVSRDMNELSEYLIKNATPKINTNYVFYRQFFPASPIPTYDIVVSAYSLLELPNQISRLETILKLWNKTERYLIIVEQGTNIGFKIINEAREFILNYKKNASNVHVFSPCPHDAQCPRYVTDNTPCNFEVSYLTLPIGEKSEYKHERYSYVVLKKDKRSEDDCKWPRIVRPVLKRSKHVICRMCTASGELEEQIFTTWKNGKNTYRCARCSEWGDRLPFETEKC
ncbi:methyltransferase-like protein 17, mitochondrial [Apis dorsata]|uniref:methyltransferase-like protein 17, mitochondrial n=1 Tax=Apis dorsata TaxID=7462 RepID=UPI0012938966|nr:methyltransferase-like protein 17, mitochondrial [Apis dorsata]